MTIQQRADQARQAVLAAMDNLKFADRHWQAIEGTSAHRELAGHMAIDLASLYVIAQKLQKSLTPAEAPATKEGQHHVCSISS